MTAGSWNIILQQGASFNEAYLLLDGSGNICDLTGCAAEMQLRASLDDPDAALTLTTENGGLTLGGTNGTITPNIAKDVILSLIRGDYIYNLILLDSGGKAFDLIQGIASVVGGATLIL